MISVHQHLSAVIFLPVTCICALESLVSKCMCKRSCANTQGYHSLVQQMFVISTIMFVVSTITANSRKY